MHSEPRIPRSAAIATLGAFVMVVAVLWLAGLWQVALRDFPDEAALQRAMPLRTQARQLWNGVRWYLTGSTPPTVVRGRDGMWFYASEHAGDGHSLDEVEGRVAPTPEEAGWPAVLRDRAASAASRGAVYLALVPPDKHTIHGELLPASMQRAKTSTRLDRLAAAVDQDGPLLDLRSAVTSGYIRSDSHWLDEGAWQAYVAIHARLRLAGQPLPRTAFTSVPATWTGDLFALRMAGPRSEAVELWQAVNPLPARYADGSPVAGPGILHLAMAQLAWLHGASGVREVITTIDDPTLPTAVIFHDSFMPALLPYLAQHFRRARFVWCHYLSPVVEAERPDVVLHENVARNVQWLGKVSDVP